MDTHTRQQIPIILSAVATGGSVALNQGAKSGLAPTSAALQLLVFGVLAAGLAVAARGVVARKATHIGLGVLAALLGVAGLALTESTTWTLSTTAYFGFVAATVFILLDRPQAATHPEPEPA